MRRVMYHVTTAPLEELLAHGIDYRRAGKNYGPDEGGFGDSPPANYLWPTIEQARVWADVYCEFCEQVALIAVEVGGLRLRRDRFWDDLPVWDVDYLNFVGPRGGAPRAYYTETPISPSRLRPVNATANRIVFAAA